MKFKPGIHLQPGFIPGKLKILGSFMIIFLELFCILFNQN